MSALEKPKLALTAPPRVDDPASLEFMYLDLARSGLVPEDMNAYPISSARYSGIGSYCIPYAAPTMYRTRHDRAVNKYIQPSGVVDVWWSPHQDLDIFKNSDRLYIIEGEKKAAAFYKRWPHLNVLGMGGAWNGLEKLSDGTRRLLPNIQRALRPGMHIFVIFDGDIETKPSIQQAATAMRHAVLAHACTMAIARPPSGKGVDDWLVETPDATLADLHEIAFEKLAESRKQLYVTLGCHMNDDKLVLNELNAKKILTHYFDGAIYTDKRLGIIKNGAVSDITSLEHHCIEYMQGQINYNYKVGAITTGMAMALTTRRDLIQEMLFGLKWDGVPRLDTWGSKHFESTFPAFADEWGRILMTGLGLRILRPGTKMDFACILVGAQGIGKSTFFEELSRFEGMDFYYACTELSGNAGDTNRTQGQMFARSVIVDLAEGVIFENKKASMDRAKQIITQTHDEYRVAYSKAPTIEPRGFVFVGTTNRMDQLGDQTGSRRFLNLETTKITRLAYHEKLQILAEVVAKEHELRSSNWYALKVQIEQAPIKLREAFSHITNVQELVNAQYHRHDVRQELLESLLDSGEVARIQGAADVMYITAGYLATRTGDDSLPHKNLCARLLSSLSTSPTFRWRLIPQRKRLPQLIMTDQMRFAYTSGVNNAQQMINGYIVEPK